MHQRIVASRRSESGMTLVELFVVAAIVTILATVAVLIFTNQRNTALNASVQSDVSNVLLELTESRLDGMYPESLPAGTALSPGVIVELFPSSDLKQLCVQGYHDANPADVWHISSMDRKLATGSC